MNYENGSENQFKKATTGTFGSLLMDSVWSIPCIDLLALADAAVTTKGSGGCYGGVAGHQGGDSEQDANTQFQNQAGESSLMPISQTNGVKYLFDLNSPPTFPEPHLITTIPSELTPITPKQTRRAVRNRVVSDILNSKVDGRKDHVALNLKQSEPIIEQSQEDIWQLEESEGFEEGSSDDSILHKTPQPKPKRRKHRPKVVIEGQSKKSTTPKSNGSSTGKRKNIIPEKSTVRSTRNSCRRKLNFEDERMSQKAFSVSPITPNKAQIEMDAINKRLRAKRSLKFSEKIHEKDKEASNALNRNDSTCNTRADATLEAILSMTTNFPEIFKKKRSGKFYNSVTCNEIPSKWYPEMSTMNDVKNQQYYKNMLGFADVDIVRKKRSKGTKRVRDMGSFDGMVECKRLYMCMEALATADFSLNISTKKRTKRNSSIVSSSSYYNHWFLPNYLGFHSSLRWKNRYYDIDDIDVMINQFENLSINKQNVELDKHALVPYLTRYQGKKGLVQYEQNRSLVPFSGVKLKKERPKVDLDDETNRVWRLLLEDINSEGIDGINEDQTKRWEEERNVFSGRAASFIARMHLIQGDRRFSRWKGSVVDSVIGVFLTQNVSDHLSSSAFMNLAAKYPLASKSSNEADVNDVFNYIEMTEERTIMQNKHEDKCGSDESEISAESKTVSYKEGEIFEFQTVSGNSMIVTDQSEITEATELYSNGHDNLKISAIDSIKVKKGKTRKARKIKANWDSLRKNAKLGKKRERSTDTMDSVDYEAVRRANVNEISDIIKDRGMNNMLAERIKAFLNRLVRDHGSIDLEWLRDVPPDKAKEYLLSFRGLGLKSVECVRLLTLHHLAFPVDTNVGRIAVRLGWVPLQPLPESLQLHLLEMYPILESIQKYLWPRLCKLDQRTLYELHYQMITFGKVFCTKNKPNCNSCPMRGECRHFASAFASARLALPAPEEKRIVPAFIENKSAGLSQSSAGIINLDHLALPPANHHLHQLFDFQNQDPAIEEPTTPEPIIEIPATPESEKTQEFDIEDFFEDAEEIPMIRLNMEEFTQNLQNYMQNSMEVAEGDMSRALVALTSEAASIPTPKLKNISQLRTEHQVYELPDSHPLLEGLDKREPDDPCPYLLALWMPGMREIYKRMPSIQLTLSRGETAESIQPPKGQCSSQESGTLCHKETCFWCSSVREANSQTVRGTLLIPCRTAMRGSFPLNGTYFQVNEVFADHESSLNPTDIPRSWLWNLPRRTVYFGTSIPTIFRGLTTEGIQHCFWRGFVCVRGFDQKTRAPRPLLARLHFPASKLRRSRGRPDDETEE